MRSKWTALVFVVLCSLACGGCQAQAPATSGAAADVKPPGKVAGATGSAKAQSPTPPARPSPEQIAKWSIPEYQPLQLLACYDGFSDAIVQSMATSPDGKQFVVQTTDHTKSTSITLLTNWPAELRK